MIVTEGMLDRPPERRIARQLLKIEIERQQNLSLRALSRNESIA